MYKIVVSGKTVAHTESAALAARLVRAWRAAARPAYFRKIIHKTDRRGKYVPKGSFSGNLGIFNP